MSKLQYRRVTWRDVVAVRFQLRLHAFLLPAIEAKWAQDRLQLFRTGEPDLNFLDPRWLLRVLRRAPLVQLRHPLVVGNPNERLKVRV